MQLTYKDKIKESNHWSKWGPYASTIFATVQGISLGSTIGGPVGAMLGGIAGLSFNIIDENMIANNVYNKHYLGNIFFWSTALNSFSHIKSIVPFIKLPAIYMAIPLSIPISYYHDDIIDFSNKVDIPMESLIALKKFLNLDLSKSNKVKENKFNNIYQDEYSKSVIVEHALNILKVSFDSVIDLNLGIYNSNLYLIPFAQTLLNNKEVAGQNKAYNLIYKIALFHLVKEFFDIAIKHFQHLMSEKQGLYILNKSSLYLTSDEARKLISFNKEEGELIIKSLVGDLYNLKKETSLLENEIKQSLEFIGASYIALIIYPNIFGYYVIGNMLKQFFLKQENERLKIYNEKKYINQNQAEMTLSDIITNLESIILRKCTVFMSTKLNNHLLDLEKSQVHINNDYLYRKTADAFSSFYDRAIEIFYMTPFLLLKKLTIDHFSLLIKDITPKINRFFFSNLEAQKNNYQTKKALYNLNKIFESFDRKTQQASRHQIPEDKIIIKNYSLFLKDQELIKIDNLELEKGHVYAITGESGSGKTSMLIDIHQGVVGALKSYGEINLPNKLETFFIDQKVFLPKGLTLKESINCLIRKENLSIDELTQLDNKIIELLEEFEVFSSPFNVDSRDSLLEKLSRKDFKLSGGQTKKIAIIQAIIANPGVLIMDETFEGLDRNILNKIQTSIKKYLPDTIIIVVDHQLEANNYNHFYDAEIHFSSYDFKILKEKDFDIDLQEIGLFFQQEKLFCITDKNTKPFEIEVLEGNSSGINIALYKKLKYLSDDTDDFSIKINLETGEKNQLKNIALQHGYIINNNWIEFHNLTTNKFKNDECQFEGSTSKSLEPNYSNYEKNTGLLYTEQEAIIDELLSQPVCICILGDTTND